MYEELVKSLKTCGTSLQPYTNDCVSNHDGCCESEPVCMYELMRKAADAIEELQSVVEHYAEVCVTEIPKWIPVAERLPEEDKTVLIFNKTMGLILFDWIHNNEWSCFGDATHWMPLPEQPKDGE